MKVRTARFGEFDVAPDRILTAAAPIPGFPSHKQFFEIENPKIAPFKWLQSIEDSSLTFVIVEPEAFFHDYAPKVDSADFDVLEIQDKADARIMLIVVLPEDLTKMTANLKAPLIINTKNNKFKQIFVLNEDYTHAHNILEAIQAKEKSKLGTNENAGREKPGMGKTESAE